MGYKGHLGLITQLKAKLSAPSTQVVTSISILLASGLLVASMSFGTNYITSADEKEKDVPVEVKSKTARRDIGDAIDLSRIPEETILQESGTNNEQLDNVKDSSITSTVPISTSNTKVDTQIPQTTVPIVEKMLISFSFTSYITSNSDIQIIFNWESKSINDAHRILLKKTTSFSITNDDHILATFENSIEEKYSGTIPYNDLGSEGLYLELQYQNDSGDWIKSEYSNIAF
jgi:hypothetical protein